MWSAPGSPSVTSSCCRSLPSTARARRARGGAARRLARRRERPPADADQGRVPRAPPAVPGAPPWYQIRPSGLDAVASDLRPPRRLDLRSYEHDVGVAWLWLSRARRQVRAAPGGDRRAAAPLADGRHDRTARRRAAGSGWAASAPAGASGCTTPICCSSRPSGRRIAVELELTSKGRGGAEKILAGYAADARIDAVLYLVRDRRDRALGPGLGPEARVSGSSSTSSR